MYLLAKLMGCSLVFCISEQVEDVTKLIKKHVSTAKFKSQNIRTVSYELPESEIDKFSTLLTELDEKQGEQNIISYGISVATLEDVFLK